MTITITHKDENERKIFLELMGNLGYEVYEEKDGVSYMRRAKDFCPKLNEQDEGWWSRELRMAKSVFKKLLGK